MRGHGYIERLRKRKEDESGFNNEKRKKFLREVSAAKIAANSRGEHIDAKEASRVQQVDDRVSDVPGDIPGDERANRPGNSKQRPVRSKATGRFISKTQTDH